jgi:adenylate cyclase
MRITIGIKIFGIAVGLLILMAVVALLSMRMTRTVDDQLVIIDHNYFPAYVALAQANIRSVEESAYVRRLLLATAERPDNPAKVEDLRQWIANAGKAGDEEIAAARQHINEQIADPLDFDDNIALARLDVRIEGLQEERQRYEAVLGKLLPAAEADNKVLATELLAELEIGVTIPTERSMPRGARCVGSLAPFTGNAATRCAIGSYLSSNRSLGG